MNPAPAVRRADLADAARLRALRLEMLADAPLAYLERLDEAAARPHAQFRATLAQRLADPAAVLYVADARGTLVGQAGVRTVPGRPEVCLVYAVYVSPPWRRTGLNGRLLAALGDWARSRGRGVLELEVVTSNNRAVRAYRSVGFIDTGIRVPHPTTPLLTEMTMVRPA